MAFTYNQSGFVVVDEETRLTFESVGWSDTKGHQRYRLKGPDGEIFVDTETRSEKRTFVREGLEITGNRPVEIYVLESSIKQSWEKARLDNQWSRSTYEEIRELICDATRVEFTRGGAQIPDIKITLIADYNQYRAILTERGEWGRP